MSAPSSHVVFSDITLGGLLGHSAIVCLSVSTPLSFCQHEWGSSMVFSLMLGFYFPKVSVLMGCPFFISCLERADFFCFFCFSLLPLAFPYHWLFQLQVWIYEAKRKLRELSTMFFFMFQSLLFACLLLSIFQWLLVCFLYICLVF